MTEQPLHEGLAGVVDNLTYQWAGELEPWQRDALERAFAEYLEDVE